MSKLNKYTEMQWEQQKDEKKNKRGLNRKIHRKNGAINKSA